MVHPRLATSTSTFPAAAMFGIREHRAHVSQPEIRALPAEITNRVRRFPLPRRVGSDPGQVHAASAVLDDDSMTNSTYRRRKSTVSAWKKSTARIVFAWASRNARQVCPALRLLARALPEDRPSVVVLDEMPYLIRTDAGFEGTLQKTFDRELSRKPVLLICVGSDLAMMEALNGYGRPFHQPTRPQRPGEQAGQGGEHGPVGPVQLRPRVLPPQH
jgi:hypothetical protein